MLRPVYIYTERNDNLAFCAIQDIIEYALVDGAFASEHIKKPQDIWKYTKVPDHRLSTPLHIADSVKETPIFRKAVKDSEGNWITSPTEAWTYEDLREYELAAAKSAGDENPGSLYKYRKGAAANISKKDPPWSSAYSNPCLQDILMNIPENSLWAINGVIPSPTTSKFRMILSPLSWEHRQEMP